MKIYTKTGDKGQTRLVGGTLVSKTDPRLESYGTVDELNSFIGVALTELGDSKSKVLKQNLLRLQNELFNLGSLLACEDVNMLKKLPQIEEAHILTLEKEIDEMSKELPELRQFILPGGAKASANLHVARTVCRRAERLTAKLIQDQSEYQVALKYLNRLSDFLFTAARFANHLQNVPDQTWTKQ